MQDEENAFEAAAREAVDLGNRLADADEESDLWDVADGLLAGAIHYWLYTRQPCADMECEDCEEVRTAGQRLALLQKFIDESARDSEYFHSPNDYGVGRA